MCRREGLHKSFPLNHVPNFNEMAITDAVLVGVTHEAMVQGMLKNTKTSCQHQCDSDFGCDSCIRAGLTAMPKEPKDVSPKRNAAVARLPIDSSHIPVCCEDGPLRSVESDPGSGFSRHAGEHDSRSTSGCFLALVGPNTCHRLTAFSKKQTSTAKASTEAEVIAANVALRAVGLGSHTVGGGWQG